MLVYRQAGAGRKSAPQKVGLGTWPAVTVDAARRAAQSHAGRIARGEDPAADRREEKRKAASSVAAALDGYESSLAARDYANTVSAMSTLRRGLGPLAARDVASLTRRELVAVIEGVEALGRKPAARHVAAKPGKPRTRAQGGKGAAADTRKHLRTFLEWTTNKGLTPFNVLAGYRRTRETRADRIAADERGRALTMNELARVWRAADPATSFGRYARALILTGARRSEMARLEHGMRAADRLRIPSRFTKQGRDHEIPLTPGLIEILEACPPNRSGLFFAAPSTGGPISGFTTLVRKLCAAAGVDFTLHDLRRTMRSGLSALGTDHDVAELMLGHQRDDLVRRYNKDDRWPLRAAAAVVWEGCLSRTADAENAQASPKRLATPESSD